ncbi:MAG: hypothetical protein KU38_07480 [Sulfurovum sp. FS08-3]|nr:MAG: hypothetical protein KU38_07480 [Sulfurovum sp. FS08-3]
MQTIQASEVEKKFDNGEDVSEYMDFSKAQKLSTLLNQSNNEYEEVKIFFPKNFMHLIDEKVKEIGVNREAFIKMLIAQNLNLTH